MDSKNNQNFARIPELIKKNFPRFARLLNFYSTRNTNLATGHWTPSRVCAMFLHLTPSIYTDAVVPEVGRPGIRKKSENDHENPKNAKKLAQNAKFSASFFSHNNAKTTRKQRKRFLVYVNGSITRWGGISDAAHSRSQIPGRPKKCV